MKTLITLAALAALTLQAQQIPAPAKAEPTIQTQTTGLIAVTPPDPDRLSPAHAAKWKELVDDLDAKAAASDKAELVFLRAKDELSKSLADNRASVLKMQAEANCQRCTFSLGADNVIRWVRPQIAAKAEEPKEK